MARLVAVSAAGALCFLVSACLRTDGRNDRKQPFFSADVFATALDADASARGSLGPREILETTEHQNRIFAANGNIYRHFRYDGGSVDCLVEGTCFESYVEFQRRMAENQFGMRTISTDAKVLAELTEIVERGSLVEQARELEKEAISRIRAAPSTWIGDPRSPRKIWALRTGFATEALQDEAIHGLFSRHSGFTVGVLNRERAPEVFELLGERVTAALVLDDRVLKDVTRADQLAELLEIPNPVPVRSRRHPDLMLLDAHLHLAPGGTANLERILERNHLQRALVSALPRNPDYEGLEEANELVLEAARRHPKLVPLVTLSPLKPSSLEDLENAIEKGARGVKLINGHGDFFARSQQDRIDPPALREVFLFCERRGIPILWHVNTQLYRAGLFRVLRDFPGLKVVNPHAGGYLTYSPETIRQLLLDYPNYYVDLSWGMEPRYLRRAVEDLSYKAREWRSLLMDLPDRFLFGSDLVVSGDTSLAHANMVYEMYENMLAAETYDLHYFPHQGYTPLLEESHNRDGLLGLNLPPEVLRKVYWENAVRLFRLDE